MAGERACSSSASPCAAASRSAQPVDRHRARPHQRRRRGAAGCARYGVAGLCFAGQRARPRTQAAGAFARRRPPFAVPLPFLECASARARMWAHRRRHACASGDTLTAEALARTARTFSPLFIRHHAQPRPLPLLRRAPLRQALAICSPAVRGHAVAPRLVGLAAARSFYTSRSLHASRVTRPCPHSAS